MPRLFLLDNEYRAVLLEAELAWIQAVIADLMRGSFAWGAFTHNQADFVEKDVV